MLSNSPFASCSVVILRDSLKKRTHDCSKSDDVKQYRELYILLLSSSLIIRPIYYFIAKTFECNTFFFPKNPLFCKFLVLLLNLNRVPFDFCKSSLEKYASVSSFCQFHFSFTCKLELIRRLVRVVLHNI